MAILLNITTIVPGTFIIMYCIFLFWLCLVRPGVAINVSIQHKGRSLPDIILLTQIYYH